MSDDADRIRLSELRREFDDSFARAPAGAKGRSERFIGVRIAGDRFALRVSEVASLHPISTITRLPGAPRGQLGIVGLRGQLVVLYDAATLLGYSNAGEAHRWCALFAADRTLGIVIDAVDGYLRVEDAALRVIGDAASRLSSHTFEHDGLVHRVLAVAALRSNIAALAGGSRGAR